MTSYEEFIRSKLQFGSDSGFDPLWMPPLAKDFQVALIDWAVRKGRASVMASCGLGKTGVELAFAENVVRKTNKRVLILTPLSVTSQFVTEGEKFGVECKVSRDGKLPNTKVVVTNYQRLKHFNPDDFAGAVCDESQVLRDDEGVTKAEVQEFLRRLPYRLLGTATPAPNDYIELGTQSEVLGYMGYVDMLGRFFKNDQNSNHPNRLWAGGGKWRFRGHAETDFWRWVCSWGRAVRRPSDLGFSDADYELPGLDMHESTVQSSYVRPGRLFPEPAVTLPEQKEERRRTLKQRCEKAAELAMNHPGSTVLWCHLNPEGDLLKKLVPGSVQVSGKDSDEYKEEMFEAFKNGQIKKLVTKGSLGGRGLNWQHCDHQTFFPSYCYDQETELLTASGWRKFGDLIHGEPVATINPDTSYFEWQVPTDYVWNDYEGPMIRFVNQRSMDIMVTPNHRMWVQRDPNRYPDSDGRWHVRTAQDIYDNFKRQCLRFQTVSAGWLGSATDSVEVPKSPLVDYTKARTKSVGSIPSETMASLAGWYLSEGCVTTLKGHVTGTLVICQTDNHPENRDKIIATMKSTGLPVNHKTKDIIVCNRELALFMADQFGMRSANMKIPRWVKDWPVELLRIMWDAIMDGDGMHCNGVLRGLKSTSKRLIEDCQEVAVKLGISTSDKFHPHNTLGIRSRNSTPAVFDKPEMLHYFGKIGCVTVPNGLLVVRRNGHAVICGNSFETWHQCMHRSYRFGQKNRVRIDMVASEGEAGVLARLKEKAKQAEVMFDRLVALMNDQLNLLRVNPYTNASSLPPWMLK